MNKFNADMKAGDKFSMVGKVDGVTRNYTVVAQTRGDKVINGDNVGIANVTATNDETGENAVFALSELVG